MTAQTVKVKPLVWRDSYGVLRAETPFGDYKVAGRILHHIGNPGAQSVHGSTAEAQAAAQADHEARILSALDTTDLEAHIGAALAEAVYQRTGVHDREGREICVGDRIMIDLTSPNTKTEYWRPEYKVVFIPPHFTLKHVGGDKDSDTARFYFRVPQESSTKKITTLSVYSSHSTATTALEWAKRKARVEGMERLPEYLASFERDNWFRLGQVQGFIYGDERVVRDCWLPPGEQEVLRKPASEISHDEVMDFIYAYRLRLAIRALIAAEERGEGKQ